MLIYAIGKSAAERKFWEMAEKHPEVDFVSGVCFYPPSRWSTLILFHTVLPPAVFGPLVSNYPTPSTVGGLGTNEILYELLQGRWPNVVSSCLSPKYLNSMLTFLQPAGHAMDVRDVARAYLQILDKLTTSPLANNERKRVLLVSQIFTYDDIVSYLRVARPELEERLPKKGEKQSVRQASAPLDVSFARDLLGFESKEWTAVEWEKTLGDVLDLLLGWEESQYVRKP